VVRRIRHQGLEHSATTAGSKEYGGCYEWAAQAAYFADCVKVHLQTSEVHSPPRLGTAQHMPSQTASRTAFQAAGDQLAC
jgi:hypothetical protein